MSQVQQIQSTSHTLRQAILFGLGAMLVLVPLYFSPSMSDYHTPKFILVQMPYDSREYEQKRLHICEKITVERVQRVMQGYSYKTPRGNIENIKGRLVHLCPCRRSPLR